MSERMVCEYGPDIVHGMPQGQRMKMVHTVFENITVVEEFEPIGTQRLRAEDIVEELRKVPDNIRRYIISVVLSPFSCPPEEFFGDGDKEEPIFASGDWAKGLITIYAIPIDRDVLKDKLAKNLTLAHEAGHIIDWIAPPKTEFLSCTPRWSKAMCEDSKILHSKSDWPSYVISPYVEKRQSLREDFADSVKYYSSEKYRTFLKQNYPNRYKILEELIDAIL